MELNNPLKKYFDIKGSILLLMLVIMALLSLLGVSLLSISILHYDIKRSDNKIKQCFYLSEAGLNLAYKNAYDLIEDAVEDSLKKSDDYMLYNPGNSSDNNTAESIFKNNFKIYIIEKIRDKISYNSNPYIKVYNEKPLSFIEGKLSIELKSKYVSKEGIEKIISFNLIVKIPDYIEAKKGTVNYKNLLNLSDWKIYR